MKRNAVVLVGFLAVLPRVLSAQMPAEAPETWGLAEGYTTVLGSQLTSEGTSGLSSNLGGTWCTGNGEWGSGVAHLDVPDGARLYDLEIWSYDINPLFGMSFEVLETCQYPGYDPPVHTLLGSTETVGDAGTMYSYIPLGFRTANTRDCTYAVRVYFNQAFVCLGSSLQIQKVALSWNRQVSPAPATATFSDVPTNHPLFQFIEALASSGVTGGCGSGNYCPDTPLTRGQMATFLARALGLQWP